MLRLGLVFLLGWDGIGNVAAALEVKVQVPGAYYAVSST